MKDEGRLLAGFADMSSALSLTRLTPRPLGRHGLGALATLSGQCTGEGAITCSRIQIAAAIDPTCSCRQREYLGPYRASTIKSTHSVYSGMILIEIREGR